MGGTPGLDLVGGLGLLGQTEEDQKLTDYYWSMRARGLEVAQNVADLADQWVEIQGIKQSAKDDLAAIAASAMPPAPIFGIGGAVAVMAQMASIYTKSFKPAVDQANSLFDGHEERMRMATATFGWLQNNMIGVAASQMDAVRIKVGFADYADTEALDFIRTYSPDVAQDPASAGTWVVRMMRAASNYMGAIAPDLKPSLVDAVRIQAAKSVLLDTLDKSGIAEKFGIPLGAVDQALKDVGLGEPITIALIIVGIALLIAAGAVVYAVTQNGAAAAAVGKNEIDRMKAVALEEVAKIRADAAAIVTAVAAEPDVNKRNQLSKDGLASLGQTADDAARKITAQADAAKKNIDAARQSFDFSILLWGGGAALAGFVLLKLFKVL